MIISKLLTQKITSYLISVNLISSDLRKAYDYCITYVLDMFIFYISIISISILFHRGFVAFLFVTLFIISKALSGGAHAPTQRICTFLSYSITLFCIYIIPYIPNYYTSIAYLIPYAIVILLTPIPNKTHIYSPTDIIKLKKLNTICIFIQLLLFILFFITNNTTYCITIELCAIITLINQLIGLIQYRKKDKNICI